MSFELPPGIHYLLQRSPQILGPLGLFFALTFVARTAFAIQIPNWILTVGYVISPIVAFMAQVLFGIVKDHIDAAAVGATLPPKVYDPSPGGIFSVISSIRALKSGYLVEGINERFENLGYTFNARFFFENRIFTAEPDYIKALLTTNSENFVKGKELRSLFFPLLGTGVFAVDGDMWKFHRSMSRPFFSKDRVSHFDNFDRHADDAVRQIKARLREGHPIDFQDVAARFTLDSATEFLFGNDVGSLSAGLPYPFYSPLSRPTATVHMADRFAKAFGEAQLVTASRLRYGDRWPLAEFWHDKIQEPMSVVHSFVDPLVHKAIEKKRAEKLKLGDRLKPEGGETLLDFLVNSTEDHALLRDEIITLLVAGRDTTASTLSFAVYMLAEHSNVLKRLREEILTRIGPSNRPTLEDFKDMKYLRAVINETLRLYPILPMNSRTTKAATTWPSKIPGGKPLYIPANTRIPFSIYTLHRRTDLWGPDALEFDPDRFIDERLGKYLTPNPSIFLPFNTGPRICLGQQFAYHEVSFFLVRLLQNFSSVSLAPAAQPPSSRPPASWATGQDYKSKEKIWPKTHLTTYVDGGLWVTIGEAQTE